MWLNAAAVRVAADKELVPKHPVNFAIGLDLEDGRNRCEGLNKERKAQLGLAMYELGMSYLNSWGVEKDERMAMTCFDLGSRLGDPDAMYELAGLWCRNGPGHRKDLHKASALYREAADRGISTVGNSWIYKEKYLRPKDEDNRQCADHTTTAKMRSFFSRRRKPSSN
ncbi:hypothetical protein V1525DRAFT_336514 [Lipomyces kononenkoae]|uniref:Uncharacterized protein n=1 Tax=Lipomyces kononenkoae TaxID=34357 RepID=A0ACC3T9M8_LIPKO